ncbi:Helix-turn-helix domain protein [Gimesia panareensis]|uniref:Helix-turn-helix domain protein n=1 Tax=Gimesia panareensis TaxID=2527978 RepID=A0A517QEJ2_9PLAN|nr:helix-turn-helix domain-containing protein [Gimesia panareensis]QDT30041.1 Helix-turn-helix domain protein [Gimesia panareensis]
MTATDEYLLVKQAAELLGVSANTIRAWSATEKLQEYRHPVNNYRLFKKTDIEELVTQITNPQPVRSQARKAK